MYEYIYEYGCVSINQQLYMTIYMACTLTLTTMGAITSMSNTQNHLMKKRGSNCLKPVDQYLFFILKDCKVFSSLYLKTYKGLHSKEDAWVTWRGPSVVCMQTFHHSKNNSTVLGKARSTGPPLILRSTVLLYNPLGVRVNKW